MSIYNQASISDIQRSVWPEVENFINQNPDLPDVTVSDIFTPHSVMEFAGKFGTTRTTVRYAIDDCIEQVLEEGGE